MIDHRKNEIVLVENLKAYLSTGQRPCEVVSQNQVSEIPSYPYVSYTVTTLMGEHKGSYSIAEDGTLYKSVLQTWSFTSQSDDQDEAMSIAMRAYAFFTAHGLAVLSDNGMTVRRVRDVTSRDNLITNQFEYRNGFDVTFGILAKIEPYEEVIETNEFKEV